MKSIRLLWLALGLLVIARALAALAPNMWGWGFGLQRFVAPELGWTLWALAVLALLPPLSRRVLPALAAVGRLGESSPTLIAVAAAVVAAALVWWLPDRVWFVGDFLLRSGAAERALPPAVLFPQALPLDVALHHGLPRLLDDGLGWGVNFTARVIGAAEAAVLALLAIAFAEALRLRGALALTATAVAFFGGYLGMFSGYGKPIAEIVLLTAVVAALGLRVLRDGRGLVPLGTAVAFGLLLHRSAIGLLPAFACCAWFASRSPAPEGLHRRPAFWVALGLPILALAIVLPRVVNTMLTLDPVHFNSDEVRRAGGIVPGMFAGVRALDLINLVALISPLALAIPFLVGSPGTELEFAL